MLKQLLRGGDVSANAGTLYTTCGPSLSKVAAKIGNAAFWAAHLHTANQRLAACNFECVHVYDSLRGPVDAAAVLGQAYVRITEAFGKSA